MLENKEQLNLEAAISFYRQGNYHKALAQINYIEKNLRSSTVFNLEGMCLSGVGKLESAVDAYLEALNIDKHNAVVHNNLGNVYRNIGDYERSLKSFESAIKIRPDVADFYVNYGNCCLDLRQVSRAKKVLDKVISTHYQHTAARLGRAKCCIFSSHFDDALQDYLIISGYDEHCEDAISGIIFVLSVYEPRLYDRSEILALNRMLNKVSLKSLYATSEIDLRSTDFVKNGTNVIKSLGSQFKTERSQIFKSNSIDFNCRRHKKIFDEKNIIASYCFSCFKVQVDVSSLSDLIRLYAYFSCVDFPNGNVRKTMVELRDEFSGFYKGLVYFRELGDANAICKKMQKDLSKVLSFNFTCAIKRGCSEFPLAFPKFKDFSDIGLKNSQYPSNWLSVEKAFDAEVGPKPASLNLQSISKFNIYDLLVIRNWVGYGCGIGDHEAKNFQKLFGGSKSFENLGAERAAIHTFGLAPL